MYKKYDYKDIGPLRKYLSEKGSICINGVSLTIASMNKTKDEFSVAIIPYTFEHILA